MFVFLFFSCLATATVATATTTTTVQGLKECPVLMTSDDVMQVFNLDPQATSRDAKSATFDGFTLTGEKSLTAKEVGQAIVLFSVSVRTTGDANPEVEVEVFGEPPAGSNKTPEKQNVKKREEPGSVTVFDVETPTSLTAGVTVAVQLRNRQEEPVEVEQVVVELEGCVKPGEAKGGRIY